MDWDDLRVFLAVAEVGSLSGAARRLRVSQATVWRRVQSLEAAVRAELFERYPTGYVLTPAGVRLAGRLNGLNRTIETACWRLEESDVPVEGEVRLSVPEFMSLLMPELLLDLQARHPGLVVELVTASPAAAFSSRDVDILVRCDSPRTTGLALEASYLLPFGLYASETYVQRFGAPAAIDRCDGHRMICFDHALSHATPEPWQSRGGRGARVVFRSNSPHARLAACRAGLGMAILPQAFVADDPQLRLLLPSEAVGALELVVYVSVELRREPRVAALRDFLLEHCPRLAVPVAEPAPVGRVMVAE